MFQKAPEYVGNVHILLFGFCSRSPTSHMQVRVMACLNPCPTHAISPPSSQALRTHETSHVVVFSFAAGVYAEPTPPLPPPALRQACPARVRPSSTPSRQIPVECDLFLSQTPVWFFLPLPDGLFFQWPHRCVYFSQGHGLCVRYDCSTQRRTGVATINHTESRCALHSDFRRCILPAPFLFRPHKFRLQTSVSILGSPLPPGPRPGTVCRAVFKTGKFCECVLDQPTRKGTCWVTFQVFFSTGPQRTQGLIGGGGTKTHTELH